MSNENKNHSHNAPNYAFQIDQQQAIRQLSYFNYEPGEFVNLRFFYHSDDPRKNDDKGRKIDRLNWKQIEDYQRAGRGVYVVVNGAGGGHEDKDILQCVAIFCEWDDRPVEEQLLQWETVGFMEPTFTVYSGDKSAQPYWVLDEPITVEQWRELQCLLIEVMGADPSNKNPSRVFRLAGGWHVKPGRQPRRTEIVQDSGVKYSYEQLRDRLLELKIKVIKATDPLQTPLQEITEPAAPDIVELVGRYVPLRKSASDWIGDCPFCQSAEQFIVKPRHKGFECLSCKAGGDTDNYHNTAADFLEKYQRFSGALQRTRYEDVQVPVPSSVPLEVCLSKESRFLLQSGVATGGRNTNGAKLARDLIGTASHLQFIGQRFDGNPRQLLDDYASRCTPPLAAKEVDGIWKSAEKDRPGPSCTAVGVEACIRGWYWNQYVKPSQPARGGRGGSFNGSGGADDGSNNSSTVTTPYTLVKQLMCSGLTPAQLSGELVQLSQTTGYQLGGLERLRHEIEAELSKEAVQAEDAKEFVKLVDYRQQDLDLYRVFPKPLASMLLTKADSDRIDPAFPYLSLLPTAGGQLGGHMALLGKEGETPGNDWLEYPMLWTMVVAPPSSGKSQTQRTIMGPIKRVQDRTRANYKKSLKYLDELEKQWQKLSDVEQAQLKDSDRNPNTYREQMPQAPRIHLIEGGSPEGAFKRMAEQGASNGVVFVFDELSRLLALDQYKSNGGDTRQLLLQAWNGPLSIELHRTEDNDSILLNSVCLSLTGGIQPGKVRQLMADPDDGDGLLSRILIGTTKTPENFDKWSDTKVAVDEALSGLYEHLRNLHYDLREQAGLPEVDENGQQPTLVLRFSGDAEELWHQWWEQLRRGMKAAEHENLALYGYLGKMLSQSLRLALEFHAIELYYEHKADPLQVERQTLERAIYAARWHIGQFRLLQAGTDNASLPGELAKIHAFALRRGKEVSAEQVQNSVFKRAERKPTLASIRQWFAMIAQAGAAALAGAGRNLKLKAITLASKAAELVGIPTDSDKYSDNTTKPESVVQQVQEELFLKNSDNPDKSRSACFPCKISEQHRTPLYNTDSTFASLTDPIKWGSGEVLGLRRPSPGDDSLLGQSDVEEYDHDSSPSSRNCRNDSELVLYNPHLEQVSADQALSEKQ